MTKRWNMKFYSELVKGITPYTAGEQPIDKKYIKLNTNENPYAPSPKIYGILQQTEYEDLRLYPDPNCTLIKKALQETSGIEQSNIFVGNGSDEVLSMCFAAFFNPGDTIAYADITYSFYEVYAAYYGLKSNIIPLKEFIIKPEDYINVDCKGIIIANPNAPTGNALNVNQIEGIIKSNQDKIIIIDQAYIAFCEYSATHLIKEYSNVVVVETLSKSHSLAGARCGMAFANQNLIKALERIKNSINSYTINRLSLKLAAAAIYDKEYYDGITKKIIATRERIYKKITELNLFVIKSHANFLFVKLPNAERIYLQLKQKGILVRYFKKQGISDFIRLTIGKDDDMDLFLLELKKLLA